MPICLLTPLLLATAIASNPPAEATSTSSFPNPRVTFTSPGPKIITLRVCNSGGCSTTTRTIVVLDPLPKISSILGPSTVGTAQGSVLYSASVTGKPPLSTSWTLAYPDTTQTTSSSPSLTLTPLEVGPHTITLKASNLSGLTSASRTVSVVPNYFADVPPDHWAASFINTFYLYGFTAGCGADPSSGAPRFCPSSLLSRAEVAVFLGRALHPPPFVPRTASGVFADVAPSASYASWVEQIYRDGITSGCQRAPVRLFCPSNSLTRAEMSVLLIAAIHGPLFLPPPATGIFADVPRTYWAARWIEQLLRDGVTSGCQPSPRLFCPESSLTRAEIAVFIDVAFHLSQHPSPSAFTARLCSASACSYPTGIPIAFDLRVTGGIPDAYDFDWNGDGIWDQTVSFPVAHTYTSPGVFTPRVRLRFGSFSATLNHPYPITISTSSGLISPPSNLTAAATGLTAPSPTDPPGTPLRVSYTVSATLPSSPIRGYAAYVNANGLSYTFATLLPATGGALLLPPPLPGAPARYLSLTPFTATSRGISSIAVRLP
jgi:PKD repeat protein